MAAVTKPPAESGTTRAPLLRITKMAVSREDWFKSLTSNFKEFMRPLPRAARRPVQSNILLGQNSGLAAFWGNFKSAFAKGVPKGVEVPDIWTKDTDYPRRQAFSLAIHVVVMGLVVSPLLPGLVAPNAATKPSVTVTSLGDVSAYLLKPKPQPGKKDGGGGGGGEHNPIPASGGKLAKTSLIQFTPPSAHPPEMPKLQMTPTIVAMPDIKIPSPNVSNYGDPLMKAISDSNGPGGVGGIGTGQGTGVGPGDGNGFGPGLGWNRGGEFPIAGADGYGQPACVYCPQPPFSDEAVRAKVQGVVTLALVVQPDGRATDIRVLHGVGLGLDQKAAETLRTWRFHPAIGPNHQPAAVRMIVEVAFNLY